MALRVSEMTPEHVGHVHAHGLSTLKGDEEEARAINSVLGDRSHPVPVAAAKSYFGNLGAGGGVVELICSILSLRHERLFPVLNFETPDPNCPLNVVRDADADPGDSALNISFSPQGQASCVLVRKAS